MTTLTPFLLIAGIIIFSIGIYKAYGEEPDELIWALDEPHGLRLVPIYYVEQPISSKGESVLGLYNPNTDIITIKDGYALQWAATGGTIRDHEILHAFGYNHVEMRNEFYVENPNDISNLYGLYEPDNIHHWSPNYEHIPFDSSCMRCKQ